MATTRKMIKTKVLDVVFLKGMEFVSSKKSSSPSKKHINVSKFIALNSIGTRFYYSYYVVLYTENLLLTPQRVSKTLKTPKVAFDVTNWCRCSPFFH